MSGSTYLPRTAIFAFALVLAVALVGCKTQGATYVEAGTAYTEASVMSLVDNVDTAGLAKTSSDSAAALRHEALIALRSRGGSAVGVADLVTSTFPADTRGVPVYFERATYKSKPAVIVVEATGPEGGKLTARRIWVLDEKGNVLFVGAK